MGAGQAPRSPRPRSWLPSAALGEVVRLRVAVVTRARKRHLFSVEAVVQGRLCEPSQAGGGGGAPVQGLGAPTHGRGDAGVVQWLAGLGPPPSSLCSPLTQEPRAQACVGTQSQWRRCATRPEHSRGGRCTTPPCRLGRAGLLGPARAPAANLPGSRLEGGGHWLRGPLPPSAGHSRSCTDQPGRTGRAAGGQGAGAGEALLPGPTPPPLTPSLTQEGRAGSPERRDSRRATDSGLGG